MARGLLVLPHCSPKSHLIRTGVLILSPSKDFTKFHTFSISRKSNYVRLLCGCSSNIRHESIKLSNYKESFAKRMAMAGLKPHHRIAVGVSGGPDSIALCLLAADWKTYGLNIASRQNKEFIDGLLAIIVDHGLRPESKDEAEMVQRRVLDMGIRCEIAHCNWTNGKPKLGHLQEAARDMRYEKLQKICIQNEIGVLLIAHHADDQAELFILRLSRNSGVLGLAGMALAKQLYATHSSLDDGTSISILLVRPLLDLSKQDLYKICEEGKQEWVEDPTNQKTIFARNRIRMALGDMSSSIFKSELQAIISACRMTRVYVDQICGTLLKEAVTIMPEGYAVIDLKILNPLEVPDICLSKFVTLVLQFISQRQQPVRGNAQKLLLNYIRTLPCKTSFTAAGCYLCPAPGSKGTKLLICCSVNSNMKMEPFFINYSNEKVKFLSELEEIIENGRLYLYKMVLNASDVPFLNTKSSDSILTEAKKVKILSDSTYTTICSLQKDELEKFILKTENVPENGSLGVESVKNDVKELCEGQIGHFMDRFLVSWEFVSYGCGCVCGGYSVMEVRHMVDDDWLYLSTLTKSENLCSNFVKVSAEKALRVLKSIPVAARRSLPVLVNPKGQIISIANVGFSICSCMKVSVRFNPRVPLGGGYSSFL